MNQNTFCSKCHRIPSQCGCNTAPRELSDVEIHYEVDKWERQNNYKHDADVHKNLIEFARAILKKVSEK